MITINFKDCCKHCRRVKPYMTDSNTYEDPADVITPYVAIGCDHEQVCEIYNEEDNANE